MTDKFQMVDLLAATAEVCGVEAKPAALALMADDLANYPLQQVDAALTRVRREVTGRLTLDIIMQRMHDDDGRPGADEAWAIASLAADESETVVWTREMAEAFEVARPVLEGGDKVGARMAFRGAYERLVSEARKTPGTATWSVSLGHDSAKRGDTVQKAVAAGLLQRDRVAHLLPAPTEAGPIAGLLTGKTVQVEDGGLKAKLAGLRAVISSGARERDERKANEAAQRISAERELKRRALNEINAWEESRKGAA